MFLWTVILSSWCQAASWTTDIQAPGLCFKEPTGTSEPQVPLCGTGIPHSPAWVCVRTLGSGVARACSLGTPVTWHLRPIPNTGLRRVLTFSTLSCPRAALWFSKQEEGGRGGGACWCPPQQLGSAESVPLHRRWPQPALPRGCGGEGVRLHSQLLGRGAGDLLPHR